MLLVTGFEQHGAQAVMGCRACAVFCETVLEDRRGRVLLASRVGDYLGRGQEVGACPEDLRWSLADSHYEAGPSDRQTDRHRK